VWPWRPVGDVPDLPDLVDLVQRMMSAHRGRFQQSTTGSLRRGEGFYVYGRAGRPCRRCGTRIRSADEGDYDRITYWCPSCQPDAPNHAS
jgi:endonuclease-8